MAAGGSSQDPSGSSSGPRFKPFSLTYVEYEEGNLWSFLLAVSSLAPVFLVCGFVTLVLFKRDLHTMAFFAGQLGNEALNAGLKAWARQPRPRLPGFPGAHGKWGWPSNHAQFMAFFTAYSLLFLGVRLGRSGRAWWRVGLGLGLLASTGLIGLGRVELGHHTANQVLWGLAIGAAVGAAWFGLVHWQLSPHFGWVVSWRLSEWLLVRDYTPIPSVIFFDYSCARNEARARTRKHSALLKRHQ